MNYDYYYRQFLYKANLESAPVFRKAQHHAERPYRNAHRSTPWGVSQYAIDYAPGLIFYGTASHGGFLLGKRMNAKIHPAWRNKEGAYEEDIAWAIVALSFPEHFSADEIEEAESTAKNWLPDAYETIFDVTLTPDQSYVRAQDEFQRRHHGDWVVRAAWGDWHEEVPIGKVAVCCERASTPGEEAWFLVPAEEYRARREDPIERAGSFVVDPSRHESIAPLR